MSSAPVRPAAVRRKIEAWLAESDPAPAIALRANPEWTSDPVMDVNGTSVRIVPCPTPLAAYAALASRAEGERLALLTRLKADELGDGLLSHFSGQTVRSVDAWEIVRQLFGNVLTLDPALVKMGTWVADALGDYVPTGGWPTPNGSLLTRDHALSCLASTQLELERIDLAGLLQWTRDTGALLRFTQLPAIVLDGLEQYLIEVAGQGAVPVLAAVRAGHGVDVVPLGLLLGVLWPEQRGAAPARPSTAVAVARTRLEHLLGDLRLADGPAIALRDAAAAWSNRVLGTDGDESRDAHRVLARAEAIASQLGATELLGASPLLPSGFTHRLRAFATAVRLAVPAAATADAALVERAQEALARAEEHQARDETQVETARMAVRLLRWLTTADDAVPATVLDAVNRQVTSDGWADRARLDVFAGETDPRLTEAYQALHRAVDARRARHDRQFANLLAQATANDAEPGGLLRVEDVLDRVIAPLLGGGHRVLLLVLDGMSVAASTEVAESLTRDGSRIELTLGGGPRAGVLAALPTVTEVSRCSLFSGHIAVGKQADERVALRQKFPDAVLLHKAGLQAGAGSALDEDVVAALADPDTSLVAAVVNTIDDALDRGEPGTLNWEEKTLPAVRNLLTVANGRVLVILSDHGHVVDRNRETKTQSYPGYGNRWRAAEPSQPAGEGELVYTGPRVGLGGGQVVLPWREELRYGPKKAGYHGGAAAAEAVIPLLVFSKEEKVEPGWAGAPVPSPRWWREPISTVAQPVTPSPAGGRRAASKPSQDETLFALVLDEAPRAIVAARPLLVEELLVSEVYARRRGTRAPLPDERVAALLTALLERGDRANFDTLAAEAGVPAHRIGYTVTALRKLLQVEGYPVLAIDPDGVTVRLDRKLLAEQFGLSQP